MRHIQGDIVTSKECSQWFLLSASCLCSQSYWGRSFRRTMARSLFPIQGFASGNLERDAKAIRIFLDDGHSIGLAQSFAKNMGLYGQRVGCLSLLCEDEKQAVAVKSQLHLISRPMYSNPPLHGALVVSTVLGDPELKKQWLTEVKVMADRIIGMRTALRGNEECINYNKWIKCSRNSANGSLCKLSRNRISDTLHGVPVQLPPPMSFLLAVLEISSPSPQDSYQKKLECV